MLCGLKKCGQAKHTFLRISNGHMSAYRIRVEEAVAKDLVWVTQEQLNRQFTLPSAFRPFLEDIEFFGWGG